MQARHLDRRRYFMEEAATTEKYFIPYLSRFIATSGVRVLEVGCGEGGNLLPFAQGVPCYGCGYVGTENQTGADLLQGRRGRG